jgi:hypothetical protein
VAFCDRLHAYDATADTWTALTTTASFAESHLPGSVTTAPDGASYGLEWDDQDVATLTRITVVDASAR